MSRRNKGRAVHGWLVLDKPAGVSSTEAVARAKAFFQANKAGHAGTLDPIATGVLPIAFGEATKTVPHLVDSRKTYRFTARFGEARDTDDCEGRVTATSDVRPSAAAIEGALPGLTGVITQTPPQFSAIKIAGNRAYDLARAGESVDIPSREVRVESFHLVSQPDPDHAQFEVVCGKGTYVRALVRDLAQMLGTFGHVVALRRTRVGPFAEEEAISLDNLMALGHDAAGLKHLRAVETPLDDIPAVPVTANDAGRLKRGQAIQLRAGMPVPPEVLEAGDAEILCTQGVGRPVALCAYEAGLLRPLRVFNLY